MASLSTEKKTGRRTIQFVLDGKRRSIRLGKVNKKQAETIKRHVEAFVASKITGHPPSDDSSRWVAALSTEMRQKLVRAGLLNPRESQQPGEVKALGDLVGEYCEERTHDCEESTVRKIRSSLNQLVEFLGADAELASIRTSDAYGYQLSRRRTCAQASVSKDVKIDGSYIGDGFGNRERHELHERADGRTLFSKRSVTR